MAMARPILYGFTESSCTWRVRIALAFKGIDHEFRIVSLATGQNKSPEYLKINPLGQLPALDVNGTVLSESMSVLEYLEEAYPSKPLLPKALLERAQVRRICQLIISGIQPLQHRQVAQRARQDSLEQQQEWKSFYINKGFKVLETILAGSSGGKFCVGNALTLADCCLVPQVYNAIERFHIDLSPYPKITGIYNHLYTLDEVKSSDPSHTS